MASRAKPKPTSITPTVDDITAIIPPGGRRSGSQCRACKLRTIDTDAWREMTDMLLRGESLQATVDMLAKRGHRFTRQKLSTHRTHHIDPVQVEAAKRKALTLIEAELAKSTPAEDIIAALVTRPSAAILEGLKAIDLQDLAKAAKADPVEYVEFCDRHAKVIALVFATVARTKIYSIKVRLDAARADQEADALLTRALSALRKELSNSPKGLQMLEALQEFVSAPAP